MKSRYSLPLSRSGDIARQILTRHHKRDRKLRVYWPGKGIPYITFSRRQQAILVDQPSHFVQNTAKTRSYRFRNATGEFCRMIPAMRGYRPYRIRALVQSGRFRDVARFVFARIRLRASLSGHAPKPFILVLEVSRKCQLSCTTCPYPLVEERERTLMPAGLFTEILDQMDVSSLGMVVFSGLGEPLMHPELFAMTSAVKRRGVPFVRVNTNGTLLTLPRIRSLLSESGTDEVRVSIGAATSEYYTNLKGKALFEMVEANLLNLLSERGQNPIPFLTLQILRNGENTLELERFQQKWEPRLGPGDRIQIRDSHTFAGQVAPPSAAQTAAPSNRLPCRQLWGLQYVTSDGTVLPCCIDVLKRLPLGQLGETTLPATWSGNRLAALRKTHLSGRWDEIPGCLECSSWWYLGSEPK